MVIDWTLALSGLLLLSAGALAGVGVAFVRLSARPPSDLEAAINQLRAERSRDKAELAELAERMLDAGERIQRSRARHEAAAQRAEEKYAKANAPPDETEQLPPLEAIKLRARRMGKL